MNAVIINYKFGSSIASVHSVKRRLSAMRRKWSFAVLTGCPILRLFTHYEVTATMHMKISRADEPGDVLCVPAETTVELYCLSTDCRVLSKIKTGTRVSLYVSKAKILVQAKAKSEMDSEWVSQGSVDPPEG